MRDPFGSAGGRAARQRGAFRIAPDDVDAWIAESRLTPSPEREGRIRPRGHLHVDDKMDRLCSRSGSAAALTGTAYVVWRVRWHGGERERNRTFDRLTDARAFEAKVRTLKRNDGLAEARRGNRNAGRVRRGVVARVRAAEPRAQHPEELRAALEQARRSRYCSRCSSAP